MDAADQAYRDVFTAVPGIFMAKTDYNESNKTTHTKSYQQKHHEKVMVCRSRIC